MSESKLSLVNRLRGIYAVAVNDGAGPLNGSGTFTRRFDGLPPINEEAAKRIEELEAIVHAGLCNFQGPPCGNCEQCGNVRMACGDTVSGITNGDEDQ